MFYKPNDIVKRFDDIKVRAKEIWDKDKTKIQTLQRLGYKVFIVWENDYLNNREKTIEDCIAFLKK